MSGDERYMRMALRLAAKGLGGVEPNPAVGAVIVKNGRVIGRGWHKKFGAPHAEINALNDCKRRGVNPRGATMFVSLEPCSDYGKTGPCTQAIIAAKLKKVVVATIDPSKHANGRGIRQLRKAGIKVDVGLYQEGAKILNAPFMKFARTDKPWVTLKWAQSIDGKLAWAGSGSKKNRWISCDQSRKDAHNLRRRAGAILVGINTVLTDDPLLTPRPSRGKKPLRIVLDNHLKIPLKSQLLATALQAPILIVTRNNTIKTKAKKTNQIRKTGAELLAVPQKTKSNLKFLLNHLGKLGVQHLLVEGGPTVIVSFLKANLADEVIVYIATFVLGDKGNADIAGGLNRLDKHLQLSYVDIARFGDDVRISGLTQNGFKIKRNP